MFKQITRTLIILYFIIIDFILLKIYFLKFINIISTKIRDVKYTFDSIFRNKITKIVGI